MQLKREFCFFCLVGCYFGSEGYLSTELAESIGALLKLGKIFFVVKFSNAQSVVVVV